MRLPGGLASEGVPYYSVYWVLGAHLPYRPRSLRRISPRLVHGFPGVHRAAVINKLAHIGPDPR